MKPLIAIDARKIGETGVGRYIESLLAGLARIPAGSQLLWTIFGRTHRQRVLMQAEAPRPVHYAWASSGVYSLGQHVEFWHLLRRHQVALLHAPHFTAPLFVPKQTRYVVTLHDVAFLTRPDLVPAERSAPGSLLAYKLLISLAARRADLILADTASAASDVERHISAARGKVRVLYPGTNLDHSSLPQAGRLSRSLGARDTLLFVGTLTARKNVHALLRAYSHSRAYRQRVRLVLAGPNRSVYARQSEALAHELGIDSAVTFTGPVSDEELLGWYSRTRVAVLPSLLEGFGLPVVEAMAAGVPCVASTIGPIQEVAQDAALLVPPGDEEALAAALDRACFDAALREELVERGRRRAAFFSVERMGEAALEIYRELLQ